MSQLESSKIGFFGDVSKYLDINQLSKLSTVSTTALFCGLNNLKYDRFILRKCGENLLRLIKSEAKTSIILKEIKGCSDLEYALIKNDMAHCKYVGRTHPHQISYYMDTPLLRAIDTNNVEVVRELIKRGIRVNRLDGEEYTPIYRARYKTEIYNLLVEAGAHVGEAYHEEYYDNVTDSWQRGQY